MDPKLPARLSVGGVGAVAGKHYGGNGLHAEHERILGEIP
jgi:hypothetical protein